MKNIFFTIIFMAVFGSSAFTADETMSPPGPMDFRKAAPKSEPSSESGPPPVSEPPSESELKARQEKEAEWDRMAAELKSREDAKAEWKKKYGPEAQAAREAEKNKKHAESLNEAKATVEKEIRSRSKTKNSKKQLDVARQIMCEDIRKSSDRRLDLVDPGGTVARGYHHLAAREIFFSRLEAEGYSEGKYHRYGDAQTTYFRYCR